MKGIKYQISTKVHDQIETQFKQYNGVMENFGNFFNSEDLTYRFQSKLDVNQFNHALKSQATKSDIMKIHKTVGDLFTRVK